MLLIDDRQAQALEYYVGFEQGVRSDYDVRQSRGRQFLQLHFFPCRGRTGH